MGNTAHGPHSNPVWSTFIFVLCMLLFLFYLETTIKPMDILTSKSFVLQSKQRIPMNSSIFAKYGEMPFKREQTTENVLVFLHIQKTAGKAFNAHIAIDINPDVGPECVCPTVVGNAGDTLAPASCACNIDNHSKSTWLFSRLTVGWPCGVHAGWTDLSLSCLDRELDNRDKRRTNRKYFMSTLLRDPVTRYLNEWKQVTSHGQWPVKKIYCHPLSEISYFNGNWTGVTFDNFIRCPDNPGNNRQVRMVADLAAVQCRDVVSLLNDHGPSINNNSLLQDAKHNLEDMPFFGLVEFPSETDRLFEQTFGVKFTRDFEAQHIQLPMKLTAEQKKIIEEMNSLDINLYEFAKRLFFQRLENISHITVTSS